MQEKKPMVEQKIKEVAERIQSVREDVGLSKEEMAERIGIDINEYELLETGQKDFPFTFIYKIAQVCNIDITDIIEGQSPIYKEYTVTRKGGGMPIVRREGFSYNNLAPMFKNKLAEPFYVKIPFSEDAINSPLHLASHKGQELDIVIKGRMKIQIGNKSEILDEGDSIYYDSSIPHDEIAVGGEDCEIYAIVMNPDQNGTAEYVEQIKTVSSTNVDLANLKNPVYEKYIETELDEDGVLKDITFKNPQGFNFAFDVIDELGKKDKDKVAMIHIADDFTERKFTFEDISKYSSMTANYFKSLGIKKGDRVMLVLKRHYQFWFSILALHKIGAVAIPATHLLTEHDFSYRFNAAGVSAIVCTADHGVPEQVDLAQKSSPTLKTKIVVGNATGDWHDFNAEFKNFSDEFPRPAREDGGFGKDTMIMFFTSGTTGYPKIAAHTFRYALGHFITAKYWHNVDPNGLHLTVSDTGWGKALWGKLYGQWLCEAPILVYDFAGKFNADNLLKVISKYKVTTLCAPATIYRFLVKEDLSSYDLTNLKYATVAGEALNPEVYSQFLKATGLRLMEGFGQTETTLVLANFIGTYIKPGSMGKPSPMYDVDLINSDGEPTAVGEVGEIVIRPDKKIPYGLFKGYYQNEEKTREAWHDDVYHTGDTAYRDSDGFYWYVGRVDDLIKSSGYRIGPFEIESVIMELPYVLECAVTAAPDPIRGQVVKAHIVLTKDKEPSEELKKEIQTYVKENTAPYKYPRLIDFREDLPKTVSGKIKRTDLR
jgi:acetyl-CoA synthetase